MIRLDGELLQNWSQRLRSVEGIGEECNLGKPLQPCEFGSTRDGMFIRANRPPVERGHEVRYPIEWFGLGLVVGIEVLLDGKSESCALFSKNMAKGDLFPIDSEGDERGGKRGIGIDQCSVEVADGDL